MKTMRGRNNGRCYYCHTTEDLTVDHIHPKSLGGKKKKHNRQTLCAYCNRMKGTYLEPQLERLFRWFKYIEQNRKEPLQW